MPIVIGSVTAKPKFAPSPQWRPETQAETNAQIPIEPQYYIRRGLYAPYMG